MSGRTGSGMIEIGGVQIPNRVFLGPMAGVTDLPFRQLCREQGAGLVYMEMISAKAITYHNRRTSELWETNDKEKPVSLQIFGHEPEVMEEACRILEEESFDILDINMGCPVAKVVSNQEGSALMKDPALIEQIVRACVRGTSRPVTVKIRAGWDSSSINAPEVAGICEDNGAKAVAVHARTRDQQYAGKADWRIIRDVKRAVSVPVFGNGDVRSGADALRMLDETGCDAVIVGRAAQGNPWIFREIAAAMQGKEAPPATPEERVEMAARHFRLEAQLYGEKLAVLQMRKHIAWYVHGMKGASRFRERINQMNSAEEVLAALKEEY